MTKSVKAEANAQLEWTSREIPAGDQAEMEIMWSPLTVWSSRETIQLTDNRNFKVDVTVILKSVDKTLRTKSALMPKPPGHRSNNDRFVTKRLALKSPSPRTKQRLRKNVASSPNCTAAAARRKSGAVQPKVSRSDFTKRVLSVQNQVSGPPKGGFAFNIADAPARNNEKENVKPAASIFETFKFTPTAQKSRPNTSSSDILASLPTPLSTLQTPVWNRAHTDASPTNELKHLATLSSQTGFNITTTFEMTPQLNGVNNQTTTMYTFETPNVPEQFESLEMSANWSQYASQKTPMFSHRPTDELASTTVTMQSSCSFRQTIACQPARQGRRLALDSLHVSPGPAERSLSPDVNHTHVISSPVHHVQLSVITEEESARGEFSQTYVKANDDHQRTYNVVDGTPANLTRDVKLVGTPLQKKCQSMRDLGNENNMSLEQQMLKCNEGSMPNLHKLETMKSIENNRYFCQSIEKDLQAQTDELVGSGMVAAAATVDDDYANGNDVSVAGEHENLGDISICSIRSTMSTQSVGFKENEILAQSSRFNLNEIGDSTKKSLAAKPIYFCIDKPASGGRGFPSKVSTTPAGQFSVSSPALNRLGSSQRSLAQSNRDIRASQNASIASRPTVISYARSSAATPGKKRDRDENANTSRRALNKLSPPKRACIDRSQSETELTKGQAFRTKTWGGVMPKKFRVPSVPMQKLILKRQPEERVILFDPDLHMQGKCAFAHDYRKR